MFKPVAVGLSLVLCLFCGPGAFADSSPGGEIFREGVEAFRGGDYRQAAAAFEAARRDGLETPALFYNLGVARYRLGDYSAAEQAFRELEDEPGWQALAHYNLALTFERRDQPAVARRYYTSAVASDDERIVRLAREGLSRIDNRPPPPELFASLSAGHDSNLTLAPDDLSERRTESASFVEGFARGSWYPAREWRLEGAWFSRAFAGHGEYNDTVLELALNRLGNPGAWNTEAGVSVSPVFLDGRRFQTRYGLAARGYRSLGGDQLVRLSGEWTRVDAVDAFDELDGWQSRAEFRWSLPAGPGRMRLAYRLELNDREDLESEDDFASYSPTRNRTEAFYHWPLNDAWALQGILHFERSRYADRHRRNGEQTRRRDRETRIMARAQRTLTERVQFQAQFSHENQRSSLAEFEFRQNIFRIGLEYLSR